MKEIELKYKRAIAYARFKGQHEIAEDFASWYTIRLLEGLSQKQKIEYAFIDYQRQQCSNNRIAGNFSVGNGKTLNVSITPDSERQGVSHALESALARDAESRKGVRVCDYSFALTGRDVFIYESIEIEGMKHREVASFLGVTEDRVSQLWKQIEKKVLRARAILEMKERIKMQESAFEINWITL